MAQGHRAFAAVWDRQTRREPKRVKALRKRVAAGATGRVLEVGVGVGTNWEFLPPAVQYTGIEPDEYMLRRAKARAAKEGREFDLQPFDVQQLPFDANTFDTVFSTATFCSVPDAGKGLAEVHRVLKHGGQFRFSEHVRSANPAYARVQRLLQPITRRFGGGCEHDRDTMSAVRAAGFKVEELAAQRIMGIPIVTGVARK